MKKGEHGGLGQDGQEDRIDYVPIIHYWNISSMGSWYLFSFLLSSSLAGRIIIT